VRSAAGFKSSPPILEIGIARAVEAVGGYDRAAFLEREGHRDVLSLDLAGGAE